ncbi:MAG: DUF3880 domain-containing protein, partial [Phycisphaerae bacterium]|nr:DUF3880 domain-containing protein [Phycisphaerae bacterium]
MIPNNKNSRPATHTANSYPQVDLEEFFNLDERYVDNLLTHWPFKKLLNANLNALRKAPCQQRLNGNSVAETIAGATRPGTVQPTVARDGTMTFYITAPDHPPVPLGYSSTPNLTAQCNLDKFALSHGNVAMNGIANGYDARALLSGLSRHQALFVTEKNPLHLNLAFQLHDFTDELLNGKMVILIGPEPTTLLTEFFLNAPGYNAIDKAIAWTWLDINANREYAKKITCAMDHLADQNAHHAGILFDQQEHLFNKEHLAETRTLCDANHRQKLRIANCTNTYSTTDVFTSRDILDGFRQIGAQTDWLTLDKPNAVSIHAQLDRLNTFKPHMILLVDTLAKNISPKPPENVPCVTLLRHPDDSLYQQAAENIRKIDLLFPADQQQVNRLTRHNVPAEQVIPLPLAANHQLFHPCPAAPAPENKYASDVALVTYRASSDPEDYNVKLDSYKKLWQAIIQEIQRKPQDYHYDNAKSCLAHAQRCGVRLGQDDILNYFTTLLQNYLGDTIVVDSYGHALKKENIDLRLWTPPTPGKTISDTTAWHQSPLRDLHAGEIPDTNGMNQLYNSAKIFLYFSSTNAPAPYLLNGIAAGAFFLTNAPHKNAKQNELNQM